MVANFEESELPYAVQIEDATGEVIWECSIAERAPTGFPTMAPAAWYTC